MSERLTITRYIAPPAKLDIQPRGTLCVVFKNDEGTEKELYVQVSHTPEDPVWMSAAELVVSCFSPYLQDPQFICNMMDMHTRKSFVESLYVGKTLSDPEAFKQQDP